MMIIICYVRFESIHLQNEEKRAIEEEEKTNKTNPNKKKEELRRNYSPRLGFENEVDR